jgi:lipopolysaccharide biosynthesis protein
VETYCIISDQKKVVSETNIEEIKAAVFVNLFYVEQLQIYQNYLEQVPDFIDIVIISPKEHILKCFRGNRFITIRKENRGRDISALLVAAKKLIFHYEYVCFIHDKKEKRQEQKAYVDSWIKNLWGNMLQSKAYIYNVLDAFQDKKIGMLVPLPPYGRDNGAWLRGAWGENYENVKRLAQDLNISGNICLEKPPVTYSTVFWARSDVLKKLFFRDWKYTDFPREPMRNDGEINHAIERVMQYAVEDAGYETKILLSTSFAASFIHQLHSEMNGLWNQLDAGFGISSYRGLDNYERIKAFAEKHSELYLYGAGKRGKECLRLCQACNIFPNGFIVTELKSAYEEIPVLAISDLTITENTGIIISVNWDLQEEIKKELEKRGFHEYMLYE